MREVVAVDVSKEPIKETWIQTSGSFDTIPLLRNVSAQPFRIPPGNRQKTLDESYRLWKYDPLGGCIVRTTTFFTLGRGLIFQFDDDKIQAYVKKFYEKNKLNIRLRAASDEANALGEVYIWLRPKKYESFVGMKKIWNVGDTQITFIPPDNITSVETADDDVGDVHNYIYEYQGADKNDHTVIIPDISKFDPDGDVSRGCIIQIKLNSGNMDPFGHSDLIPIKEWLDNYQEYLRDSVVINKLYRSPCYDVSIEDGTPEEIAQAVARYRNWTIGSNPVHNSKEVWTILEFTGPSSNNEEARRSLLLMIAAGVGFAEFMLADGSNSNLASAKAQGLPVIKKFEDRQELWSETLMCMFQFAIMMKAKLVPNFGIKIETDDEDDIVPFSGTVNFPSINQDKELEVAQTNQLALEGKYMSVRTACARLNLDFDREMKQAEGDIDKLEAVMTKSIDAGLMPDPAAIEAAGAAGAPKTPSGQKSRQGQSDSRPKRDRSREGEGSRAPVKT